MWSTDLALITSVNSHIFVGLSWIKADHLAKV